MIQKELPKPILYLMSVSAGLVVANLYYNQPLLHLIATTFHVGEAVVSNVPLSTQLGYAAGLLFVMPLGDKVSNLKILTLDFVVLIISLLVAAYASTILILIISSFFIGLTSVIPQLFVPMAAELLSNERRGSAIGIVMSGLLIGIIGSRVISGIIGQYYGWQMMYLIGAGIMIGLYIILYWKLPRLHPNYNGSYSNLMQSIWKYAKNEPVLQLAAIRGALSFAGLSAFWTTLVFVLKDAFNYGSSVAGLFGLLGIIGALGAALIGKWNDRFSKNKFIYFSVIIMGTSWLIFSFSNCLLWGLIIGTIFVDLGQQTLHITNQNIIFAKYPEARNRINTVYMVSFFIGGAIGTSIGATAYAVFGWIGVSVFGLTLTLLIGIIQFLWKKAAA